MNRAVLSTGLLLIAFGAAVFGWKVVAFDLPLRPSEPEGLWLVQLDIAARGQGARASVRAALPSPRAGQRIFGERGSPGELRFSLREEDDGRAAVWAGWMEDLHRIEYVFRVQLFPQGGSLPKGAVEPPPPSIRSEFAGATVSFPSTAPEVRRFIDGFQLPGPEQPVERIRALYAFVIHEISDVPTIGDDPILTLVEREGSAKGKERLFVTLLRAVGIPSRLVQGLRLVDGPAQSRVWTEVFVQRNWFPISVTNGFFAGLPRDYLAITASDRPLVEGTGVRSVGYSYHALREQLTPQELAAVLVPPDPMLEKLSLYRLSLPMQVALRVLLLMPIAALLIALLRNVVGIPSYGTFMPMLIALALRGTGLAVGLLLVGLVLVVGIFGRLVVERLRLLLVPRLSLLLCIVVLAVTALGLVGRDFEVRDFYAGVLFPIVILTMLIERFSVVMVEEGLREALERAGWSTFIAVLIYPLFASELAAYVMFTFPELVFVVMGALVLMGGYTGYRASELLRFRLLARLAPRSEPV